MTAAYRIVTAERNDLAVVTVLCDECGTGVSLAVATAMAPESCPSCSKPYGEKTRLALSALARFHREAKAAEEQAGKPLFRFDLPQKESKL